MVLLLPLEVGLLTGGRTMSVPEPWDRPAAIYRLLTVVGFWLAAFSGPPSSRVSAQQPLPVPPVEADIELREENYEIWRDHILPDLSEMAWNQIPWLSTFHDGILAADAASKPLLLWTMNGHPLGCT
jgi:hypothetical protein